MSQNGNRYEGGLKHGGEAAYPQRGWQNPDLWEFGDGAKKHGGEAAVPYDWEKYNDIGWERWTDQDHLWSGENECEHVHEFYLDGIRLPQTPSKFTIKNTDKTEIIDLSSGDVFTLLKKDGAKTIEFEFKCSDRVQPYQWHTSDTKHSKDYWNRLFETRKMTQEPIDVCVLRIEYDHYFCPCVLTDYTFTEDAEDNDDWTVSVTFKEYHGQNNQELDATITHHLTKNRVNAGWRSGRGE